MTLRYLRTSIVCVLIVSLVSILQQGCALQSSHNAWQGHPIDDLISSWGQPDRTKQLGVNYAAYTWMKNGTNCEHTFSASDGTITGYSSSGCDD